MIEQGTAALIIVSVLTALLIVQASRRPDEETREDHIRQRLENNIGPSKGRYKGSNYQFDFINLETHEQTDFLYRLLRIPTARFRGITDIHVRFSGSAPSTADLYSHPWLKSGDFRLSNLRADGSELRFVIPTSDPHEAKRSFDAFCQMVDHVLDSRPVADQNIGEPPSEVLSKND